MDDYGNCMDCGAPFFDPFSDTVVEDKDENARRVCYSCKDNYADNDESQ